MYRLRTLSIRDVLHALKRRKPRVAFRIAQCLISNGVNSVRFRLRLRSRFPHSSRSAEGVMTRTLALPKSVWFARAATVTTGLGLQLVGL